VLRTGRTAGHHGRYGERNFALLLALQKGTCRAARGVLGITYNFPNNSTQYQSGVDLHFDWGASQFLSKEVMVGLVGYVYKELGCDSGSGDRCFQSQVFGVGPQIGFLFPVGDMQGYLNFKAYGEFAAENRPSGWNTWVTFSISPPAPGAPPTTKPIVRKY
jgi:hypothetical protein